MTTLASRLAPRGFAARDLVAVWLTVAGVLTYLDVPLRHSPLFATNLVLQASLGTVVITGLLRGLAPSLLLFCGPGLVLGGAMSFAVYQAFGRGTVGAGVSACIGIVALVHVLRHTDAWATDGLRWWQLGQVTGMAMLVLSSEFGELLPAAALLFLLGFVNSPSHILRPIVIRAANLIGLGIAVAVWSLRQNYWWLVTDDYLFLEVVSRHITREGPLASWGENTFARYHWLSYGWSGILDVMSGSPAPLVTLTRVMPFAYAASMASSVVLLLKHRRPVLTTGSILLAWAVVAVGRFSWAGTSTGGVYALLAAAMLLGMMALEIRAHWSRKALLGSLVVVAIALTKFPSVFAVFLVSLTAVSVLGTQAIKNRRLGRVARWIGLALATQMIFATLWMTSHLLGERFAIASINPGLGQLSTLGLPFAAFTLVVNQLWLWISVLLFVFESRKAGISRDMGSHWLTPTFALAVFAGLLCELFISSNADNYMYFSGPLYFTASLSLLYLNLGNQAVVSLQSKLRSQLVVMPFLIAGWLWGLTEVNRSTWSTALELVSLSPDTKVEVLTFFTADRRVGAAVVAGALALIGITRRRRANWVGAWAMALILLAMVHLLPQSISEFRRGLPASEIDEYFGTEQERAVGTWLRSNTDSSDIVATNHGFGKRSPSLADLAMATWSDRQFLVLGPYFGSNLTSERAGAEQLSVRFADEPSRERCTDLRESGVSWFVVDTSLTDTRDWSICTRQTFASGEFLVLEIDPSFTS